MRGARTYECTDASQGAKVIHPDACAAALSRAPSFLTLDLGREFDFWPFSVGMNESLLFSASRIVFMLLILGAIFLLLRLLYGPRGIWRDHELDRMAEEETRQELAELERRFQGGEIDEAMYRMEKRRLTR
jgi:uncharacterized membrane protein